MAKNVVGIYTSSKIPSILKDLIYEAVRGGSYLNVSDFVRDAIKEKLQREGFLKVTNGGRPEEK